MQPGDNQLCRHEKQNYRGDVEEFAQVDAYAALYKHYSEDYGQGHAQQGTQEAHEFGGIERHASENGYGFNAFPENHEKDEGEQAPLRTGAGQGFDFGFNLAFQPARRAHHENDHADDEN